MIPTARKEPDPVAETLVRASTGAALASVMPEVREELESMKRTALGAAFAQIAANTLTPELALHVLIEIYSYDRLLKRLDSKMRMALGTK